MPKTLRPRKSDAATLKLLKDVARFGASNMWHLRDETSEARKLYDRIEQEIARMETPNEQQPACNALS
jgi:hypothetical protein